MIAETSSESKSPVENASSPQENVPGPSSQQEEIVVADEVIASAPIDPEQIEDQEIHVVDGEEVIFTEDVGDYEDDVDYDAIISLPNERNLLFGLYQPHQTEDGMFMCKICMKGGKTSEFPDRTAFVAHRYKAHGSFNNNVICPLEDCREVYASLYALRRHLGQVHHLPLEIHQQSFENIGEFEKFRHLVELTSGCRYMMHTKQPKYRRQVMHCAKSEHKLVLQTQKHQLPRSRMTKEGSACPSVISYRVDATNGQVHTFMQLYHIGHAPDTKMTGSANSARPLDIVFPQKPPCFAGQPMQFVQIDVHEMPAAVYGNKMYESILVVTCLKSRFMWAKPLVECTRTTIGRILNSIFNEFGVPEGFSTTFSPTYIRDTIKALESVYALEIREIWNEPPPYASLEQWVVEMSEQELGTRNRWVEQLQFVVMEYNQKPLPERPETPFQRMFNRKPPNLYHNGEQADTVASKIRRHHLELRREDGEAENHLNTFFSPGDKVFLRKGITKPRRGNNTQFYFGYVSEKDSNKYYPYKVHYSSSDSPWPSDRNMFVWVSVFDLLPTTHKIREMAFEDRQEAIALLLCTCSGEQSKNYDLSAVGPHARKSSKCVLFRNILCSNQMSRHCCKLEGRERCRFHELYPGTDESYAKMENAYVTFCHQNKDKMVMNKFDNPTEETKINILTDEEEEIIVENRLERVSEVPLTRRPQYVHHNLYRERQRHAGHRQQEHHVNPQEEQKAQTVDSLEAIDIEHIEEEILEPVEDVNYTYTEEEDEIEEEAEMEQQTSSPKKRIRKSSKKDGSPKSSTPDSKRKKTEEDEYQPPTSSEPTGTRRSSARKTIRPKNFDDYVE